MRFRKMGLVVGSMLALALAEPLAAQSTQCAAQPVVLRDACQKGTDIFTMFAPQVQGALAGGGPVLGSSDAVRGFSIGLRVNAVDGRVPQLRNQRLSTSGIVRSAIPTGRVPVPAPALDVAIGVFPGFFVGVQRLFSVEVLANVAYIPNRTIGDFSVRTTNGSLKLGYGARVGLLADRQMVPAVAVSYFRRSLPTATFSTGLPSTQLAATADDSLTLGDLSIRNDALRLGISKRLGFIEVGGGVGQDRYRTFSQLRARITPAFGAPVTGAFVLTQQIKRNAAYGSVALNILKVRLAAEAGSTFGGDSISTYNSFTDGTLNAQRLFGSVGLRLGF